MFRHFFKTVLPAVVFGFLLFAIGSKVYYSQTSESSSSVAVIGQERIEPVLERLMQSNENYFKQYNSQEYKGNVLTTVHGTTLSVSYATDKEPDNIEQAKEDAEKYFRKQLCRYISFKNLHQYIKRIQADSGTPVSASVDISVFDLDRTMLIWEISIEPSDCYL